MEFEQLKKRALEIRDKYVSLEKTQYGREWTTEELMLGFMKDMGDLAKLIQAFEGIRQAEDLDKAIAGELSDCLWSVIILADRLGVDLEKAFLQTMNEIDHKLQD